MRWQGLWQGCPHHPNGNTPTHLQQRHPCKVSIHILGTLLLWRPLLRPLTLRRRHRRHRPAGGLLLPLLLLLLLPRRRVVRFQSLCRRRCRRRRLCCCLP